MNTVIRHRKRSVAGRLASTAGLALTATLLLATATLAQSGTEADDTSVDRQKIIIAGPHEPFFTWRHDGGAFLGLRTVELTPELLQHFGVPAEAGVLVASIVADSPAVAAGLQVGDIVTAVDGGQVDSPGDLAMTIGKREAGELITLEVWRQGELHSLEATLGEREKQMVDIRRFRFPPEMQVLQDLPEIELDEVIHLDTETLNEAIERLNEAMESPEWQEKVSRAWADRQTLVERLEQLEQKLQSLEQELQNLEPKD